MYGSLIPLAVVATRTGYLPKHAVANFQCAGDKPLELQDLTRVEVTMIAICNPVMHTAFVPTSGYTALKQFRFTIVNDVVDMAHQLPRVIGPESMCILRCAAPAGTTGPPHVAATSSRELQFRPAKVRSSVGYILL